MTLVRLSHRHINYWRHTLRQIEPPIRESIARKVLRAILAARQYLMVQGTRCNSNDIQS